MFDLLFSQRGVAFGAGYADVHAQLPVLKALMVLAVLAALLCLMTIRLVAGAPSWGCRRAGGRGAPRRGRVPRGDPALPAPDLPPGLYFSELATDYVFVKTRAKEFDYPAGEQNVYPTYAGQGGSAGVLLAQGAVRGAPGGPQAPPVQRPDSRKSGADLPEHPGAGPADRPFFQYDADPYMVISAAGRMLWLLDAYPVSDRFPYSAPTRGLGNYVRNAVKVTVDAYDGTVHFYVADAADPLIRTTARIFPGLLQPLDAMPADLTPIRYPEGLFRVRRGCMPSTTCDTRCSTTRRISGACRSAPWRGRSGPWSPTTSSYARRAQGGVRPPHPLHAQQEGQPGRVVGGAGDPPHYGKLVVYNFPKQKLICGPRQIEARIDQDSFISQQLSLWSQQGAQVIRGNLLVVPIERSLVYVEPLYIAAEQGQLPG